MKYNKMTLKMAVNLAAPHTWAASIGPSVFGCVYCFYKGYTLSFWQCILLILACVLMQSSVNSINDYIDFIKGTDTADDNLERSDAVLLCENINPRSAKLLGIGYLLSAALIGVYIIVEIKCLIPLFIGIIGAAAIAFYSGGKTPISYLPVGELVSGFVMGALIPLGCVSVATKQLHFEVMLFSLPFIISIALIMMSNNGCDIEKDITAGRRTLPVLLGRAKAKALYCILLYTWLGLLCLLPVICFGLYGILFIIPVILLSSKPILALTRMPLDQSRRVEQMKMIIKANIIANGIYIAELLIGTIVIK